MQGGDGGSVRPVVFVEGSARSDGMDLASAVASDGFQEVSEVLHEREYVVAGM